MQLNYVLNEGLIRRVGDDKQIHIWNEKWLPRASSYKIQSLVKMLFEDADLVEGLIDRHEGCWNMELLQAVFNQ